MTHTSAPAFFDGCRARVDELLDAHVDMGVVEHTIDAYALDRDAKDALWLWVYGRRARLISHGERPQPAMLDGDGHD